VSDAAVRGGGPAPAIVARGVGKQYLRGAVRDLLRDAAWRRPRERFWSLRGVDLDVPHCACLGLVGSNGAGKSTLLRILARVTRPTEGRVEVHGRLGAPLEIGAGFNAELTGRENVWLNASLLGLRDPEIRRRFDEVVAFAELDRSIDTPIKRYSSGMKTRLGVSVALHLGVEILLLDETLVFADAGFRRRCIERLRALRDAGLTVLLVSHDLELIDALADRVLWLEGGRVREHGPASAVLADYRVAVKEPPRVGSGSRRCSAACRSAPCGPRSGVPGAGSSVRATGCAARSRRRATSSASTRCCPRGPPCST